MEAQPRNYIYSVLFLVALVVIILEGLRLVNDMASDDLNLKKVNSYSVEKKDSLSKKQSFSAMIDTLFPAPGKPKSDVSLLEERSSTETKDVVDDNKPEIDNKSEINNQPEIDNQLGIVKFNDYSENRDGLRLFFEKLLNIETLNRPVRIAFFGDSFIEGDILSSDLRRLFQENFGGGGVGMMPVTSQVSGFRKTVVHQFSAWNTYSFNNYSDKSALGICGSVSTPNNNAWVYYQGVKKDRLNSWNRVSVFYALPDNNTRIFYKKNKGASVYANLPKSENIGRVDIKGGCANIQISFPPVNNLYVYGVSLEDSTGVILDNYSIRSFSGTGLLHIPQKKLSQFNSLLQYDLIILGYGLNVAEAKRTDYKTYETEMVKTVNHLKESFPNTSILLVGVPDRSYKENGDYETMPGVLAMIEHQKNICKKSGIVFWNLFEAMGGKNSMPLFVNSNPPKANKDYTHLTFAGGEYLGNLLYETFMYEKEAYEKKFSMVK